MTAPFKGYTMNEFNETVSNEIETTAEIGALVNTDHPHYMYLVLAFGIMAGCLLCGIVLWIKNTAPKWIKYSTNTSTKLVSTLSGTKKDQKQIIAEESVSKNEDDDVLEEILNEVEEMKSLEDTDQSILKSINNLNKATIRGNKRISNMHNLDTPALLAQQQEGKRISRMLELSKLKEKSKSFEVFSEGHETNNNENEDIETDEWPIVPSVPDSMNMSVIIDRVHTAVSSSSLYGTYEEVGLIGDNNDQTIETPLTPGDTPMKNIVIVTNKENGSEEDDENVPAAPPAPDIENDDDEKGSETDDEFGDDCEEEDDESSSYEQIGHVDTFEEEKNEIAQSNSKLLKILPMSMSNNKRVSDLFKFDAVDTFSKLNEKYVE